jgi:hypothetical protein
VLGVGVVRDGGGVLGRGAGGVAPVRRAYGSRGGASVPGARSVTGSTPEAVAEAGRLRRAALTALREGRVTVRAAASPAGAAVPVGVAATVRGHRGVHRVVLRGGSWSCSCGPGLCPHLVAVRLVAGDPVDLERVGS